MEIPQENKKSLFKVVSILAIILALYFAVKFLNEIRNYQYNVRTSYIEVSGKGEVQAVPDIAKISFSIRNEAKTVKDAQTQVAEIEKKALDVLEKSGVEKKDIKTVNASFNPKYEYRYNKTYMPCTAYGCPPQGRDVIVGYEAYESIEVKVRDTEKVSEIVEGLGASGVENLYGPNFTIDDEEGLKAEARQKAIEDAKTKAENLAKDLGVRLVRMTSFREDGSPNYPEPMYYDGMGAMSMESKATSAELPIGENTITSNVMIGYEIR